MAKNLLAAALVAVAIVAFSANPALAYYESSTSMSTTATTGCPQCHGLQAGVTSPTVAPFSVPATWTWNSEAGTNVGTRKGPHGGYTTGTQECQICHSIHDAPSDGLILLPDGGAPITNGPSLTTVCYVCHDGTGGGGVYGVIKNRTGFDPALVVNGQTQGGVHRIDTTTAPTGMVVPGGNPDGSDLTTAYSGPGGSLTCVDCHSPHNAGCVKPFIGDRKRSQVDTTFASIATNRLLRQMPTGAATPTTQYGSDWCEACHRGRHSGTSMYGHPVADAVTSSTVGGWWNYNRIRAEAGVNTSTTIITGLGQNNGGYVMPMKSDGTRPNAFNQGAPICQQCHEDARNVGNVTYTILGPNEVFKVTAADGASSTDNPRFQNFPHETTSTNFLLEQGDTLCLNCHLPPPN